jgi:hypothetical protein
MEWKAKAQNRASLFLCIAAKPGWRSPRIPATAQNASLFSLLLPMIGCCLWNSFLSSVLLVNRELQNSLFQAIVDGLYREIAD